MNNILEKIKPILSKVRQALSPATAFFKKHSEILNPILVLTAICVVVAATLSITNSLTANRIEKINTENKLKEMRVLLPADEYTEESVKGFQDVDNFAFYSAVKDGSVEGYIITTSAKGYGGDIVVMTAFETDGKIKSISIISAEDETPGLGQNVTTEKFLSQFSGIDADGQLYVVKNSADNSAGEINAVTGATISSKGVVKAVNQSKAALAAYLADQNAAEIVPEPDNAEQDKADPEIVTDSETAGGGVIENQ